MTFLANRSLYTGFGTVGRNDDIWISHQDWLVTEGSLRCHCNVNVTVSLRAHWLLQVTSKAIRHSDKSKLTHIPVAVCLICKVYKINICMQLSLKCCLFSLSKIFNGSFYGLFIEDFQNEFRSNWFDLNWKGDVIQWYRWCWDDGSSQEVVRLWLLGWDSSRLLRRRLEYGKVPLQMFIQLQNGSNISTPYTLVWSIKIQDIFLVRKCYL